MISTRVPDLFQVSALLVPLRQVGCYSRVEHQHALQPPELRQAVRAERIGRLKPHEAGPCSASDVRAHEPGLELDLCECNCVFVVDDLCVCVRVANIVHHVS